LLLVVVVVVLVVVVHGVDDVVTVAEVKIRIKKIYFLYSAVRVNIIIIINRIRVNLTPDVLF